MHRHAKCGAGALGPVCVQVSVAAAAPPGALKLPLSGPACGPTKLPDTRTGVASAAVRVRSPTFAIHPARTSGTATERPAVVSVAAPSQAVATLKPNAA
ncbi:MAG: hypothetical protein HYZ53_07000 [Planctomycetes bacterium]|nr:hypothetical protein [Planctomycetota bacterium]